MSPTAGSARQLKLNKRECSVGTDASNDIIVRDYSVSKRHALIRWHGSKWQVIDRLSTNGTYVGYRKAIDWITLRDGQEVRFGAARFIFHAGQPFKRRSTDRASSRHVRASRLRLLIVLILAGLIAGFAAAQYFLYRSYQHQEALLHDSRSKE